MVGEVFDAVHDGNRQAKGVQARADGQPTPRSMALYDALWPEAGGAAPGGGVLRAGRG